MQVFSKLQNQRLPTFQEVFSGLRAAGVLSLEEVAAQDELEGRAAARGRRSRSIGHEAHRGTDSQEDVEGLVL